MKIIKRISALFAAAAMASSLMTAPLTAEAASLVYDSVYDIDTKDLTPFRQNYDEENHNSEVFSDPLNPSNKVWGIKPSSKNGLIQADMDFPSSGEKYIQLEFDIMSENTSGGFQANIYPQKGWGNQVAAVNISGAKVSCGTESGISAYQPDKWYSVKSVVDTEKAAYTVWIKEKGSEDYKYDAEYTSSQTFDSTKGFRLTLGSNQNNYTYIDNVKLSGVNGHKIHYEFNDVQTKENQPYFNLGTNCGSVTWSQAEFDGEKTLEGKMNASGSMQPYTADKIPDMDMVVVETRMGFDSRNAEVVLKPEENLPKQFGIIPVFENASGAKNVADWRERTNGIKFNNTRYIDVEGKSVSKTAGADTQKGYNLADGKLYTAGYVYDRINKIYKAYFITNHGETVVSDASSNAFVQAQRNLAGVQLWLRAESGNLTGKGYYDYLHIDSAEDFKIVSEYPNNGEKGVLTDSGMQVTFNYVIDPQNIGTAKLTAADGTDIPVTVSAVNGKTLIITPQEVLAKITDYTLEISGTKDLFGRYAENTEIKFTTIGRKTYLSSNVYKLDTEENTAEVMPYTTAELMMQNINAADGYTAKLTASDGSEVTGGTLVTSGMILSSADSDGNICENFTVNVSKAVSENFESWEPQQFYYGRTDGVNGWGFTFPSVAKSRVYAEIIDDELAGKVMHIYSNGDVADSAQLRMNCIYKEDLSDKPIGKKFMLKVSAKLPNQDSRISQLVSYLKKDGTAENLMTATEFYQGRLYVFKTAVGEYKNDSWNNVVICGDTESGSTEVYINGSKVYSGIIDAVKTIDCFTQARLAHHIPVADTVVESYIGGFELFGIGGFEAARGTELSASLESDMYSVIENTICGYDGLTVGELKANAIVSADSTVSVVDANGTEAEDTAAAVKGMKLFVVSKDGTKTGYLLDIEHFKAEDAEITLNGMSGLDKFADGTVTAKSTVTNYSRTPANAALILAQYSGSGELLNVSIGEESIEKGSGNVECTLNVTGAEGTALKIMFFEGMTTMKPIKGAVKMDAYSDDTLENVTFLYPNFREKAVTFSFDDLHDGDVKIIEAMDKYGVKGTFNLVTNKLAGYDEGVIKARYANHEMANHSHSHLKMYLLEGESETVGSDTQEHMTTDEVTADIVRGQNEIKAMTGTEPAGFVWPYKNPNKRTDYNEILEYIRNETGIEYIRPTETTRSFAIPTDWYQWQNTCHQDEMEYFIKKLISEKENGSLKLLAVWGHAFEMNPEYAPDNKNKVRYDDLERIFSLLDRDDIWKATNKDVCLYLKAAEAAEINKADGKIINNTDTDLYASVNGEKVLIKAHSEYLH